MSWFCWHKYTRQNIYNHEGEFSHYNDICDKCGKAYETFKYNDRWITVKKNANPLDVYNELNK